MWHAWRMNFSGEWVTPSADARWFRMAGRGLPLLIMR